MSTLVNPYAAPANVESTSVEDTAMSDSPLIAISSSTTAGSGAAQDPLQGKCQKELQ